jgi:hypothetical protein
MKETRAFSALLVAGLVLGLAGPASAVTVHHDWNLTGVKYRELGDNTSYNRWSANWDNATNWTPNFTAPGGAADTFYIAGINATDCITMPVLANNASRTFGGVQVKNGFIYLGGKGSYSDAQPYNIYYFKQTEGGTGSFELYGTGSIAGANADIDWQAVGYGINPPNMEWHFDNSFILKGNVGNISALGKSKFYFHGTGQYTPFWGNSATASYILDNLIICEGANVQIIDGRGTRYNNPHEAIWVGGTLSSGAGTYPMIGTVMQNSNTFIPLYVKPGVGNTDNLDVDHHGKAGIGGYITNATRLRDVQLRWCDYGGTGTATTRLKSNLRVRNMLVDTWHDGQTGTTCILDFYDLPNTTQYNLTVDCDVTLGMGTTNVHRGVIKVRDGTLDVGGNMIAKKGKPTWSSYLTAASGTIKVAGNFTVENGTDSVLNGWDLGTSTFIFNGAAASTQTISLQNQKGYGLSFYNVKVQRGASGKLFLDDNMVVRGSFRVESGVFQSDNTLAAPSWLIFKNGDNSLLGAKDIYNWNDCSTKAGIGSVLVAQGSPGSGVKLLTDLMMDNLNMQQYCTLYLNGHTLGIRTGKWSLVSSDIGSMPWKQGTIYGSIIPEPQTLLLVGTGVLGVLGYIRRRRMK